MTVSRYPPDAVGRTGAPPDGAGGAGDLPGQDAVRLAYEGQLRAEGGGLTEQMEIVVLVAAGLVDVPKGLPHQRFRGAAVGGGLVAKGQ